MAESRCLGNVRTNRKCKIPVYIDEGLYDAVVELQTNKNATKMLKYIENLKPSKTKRTFQYPFGTSDNNDFKKVCPKCGCDNIIPQEPLNNYYCSGCQLLFDKPIIKS